MKNVVLPLLLFVAISIHAGHHEETKVAAQGMISSEVFDLADGMDLHVEKYESCGAATGARHYHPYGILVYVLEGETVSNASGSNEPITAGNYWFEKPNWEHGGIDDSAPEIEGRVRGQLYRLVYKLEKLESNQTRVTVEIMVNPKGLLPNFMILK